MISLGRRRERLGLSQKQLGILAGLSATSISLAERRHGPSACLSAGSFDRIVQTVRQLEFDQGLRPLRDYRVAERRKRLKLSPSDLAERAFFHPGNEWRLAQVERGEGGADDLRSVRLALIWEESAARRAREYRRLEDRRIARQEALWLAVPESPEKAALMRAMLDRCRERMHSGRGEECDAIAEWLPHQEVMTMFERWQCEYAADRLCDFCVPSPLVLAVA